MTFPTIPSAIENAIAQNYPGSLALLNIADFKRRNIYLGYVAGDRDIESLESMLQSYRSAGMTASRVSGDDWLVWLPATDLSLLKNLINDYALQQPAKVGWQAVAKKPWRRHRKLHSTRLSSMCRGLRCVYTSVESGSSITNDIAKLWWQLEERIGYARVNQLASVNDPSAFITDFDVEPRWRCINDRVEPSACPYCASHQFEWDAGDDSIFSGEGRCCHCHAQVSFENVFEFCDCSTQ